MSPRRFQPLQTCLPNSTSKANQFKSSKSNQNKFEQIKSKQIRRMSSAVFQPGKSKTQPALPKQQARAANPASPAKLASQPGQPSKPGQPSLT
jgi:hypothetical protein